MDLIVLVNTALNVTCILLIIGAMLPMVRSNEAKRHQIDGFIEEREQMQLTIDTLRERVDLQERQLTARRPTETDNLREYLREISHVEFASTEAMQEFAKRALRDA